MMFLDIGLKSKINLKNQVLFFRVSINKLPIENNVFLNQSVLLPYPSSCNCPIFLLLNHPLPSAVIQYILPTHFSVYAVDHKVPQL